MAGYYETGFEPNVAAATLVSDLYTQYLAGKITAAEFEKRVAEINKTAVKS